MNNSPVSSNASLNRENTLNFSPLIQKYSVGFVGRKWVLDGINKWLESDNAPQFFFISGEPGIGKTAISVNLVNQKTVDAYHFCVARDRVTIDPSSFIRSICLQLAKNNDFAKILIEKQNQTNIIIDQKVDKNSGQIIGVYIQNLVVDSQSASSAFVNLIIEPLIELNAKGKLRRTVILVDALDEAIQHTGLDNIVKLLANTGQLPQQVRFICTTRHDKSVLSEFEHTNTPVFVLDANSPQNIDDVRIYTTSQLEKMTNLSGNNKPIIEKIVLASEGNFLYLKWLLPYISSDSLTNEKIQSFPKGLDGIYREFLKTRIGKQKSEWQNKFRDVFGVLVVAQTSLSESEMLNFTGIKKQTLRDMLQEISQFLDPVLFQHKKYLLYHQSISDFFRDENKSDEFWIDAVAYHQQIITSYSLKSDTFTPNYDKIDSYGLQFLSSHLYYDSATYEKRHAFYNLFTNLFSERKRELGIQTLLPDIDKAISLALDNGDNLYLVRLLLIYAKIKNEILEGAKLGTIASYAKARNYHVAIRQAEELGDVDLHFRQKVLIAHIALLNNDEKISFEILSNALKLNLPPVKFATGTLDNFAILLITKLDELSFVQSLAEKTKNQIDVWLCGAFKELIKNDPNKAVRAIESLKESGWTIFFRSILKSSEVIHLLEISTLELIILSGVKNNASKSDLDWYKVRWEFANLLMEQYANLAKEILEATIKAARSERRISNAIEGILKLRKLDYQASNKLLQDIFASLVNENADDRQVAENINEIVSALGEFEPLAAIDKALAYCKDVVDSRQTKWGTISSILKSAINNKFHIDKQHLSEIGRYIQDFEGRGYVFDNDLYGALACHYEANGENDTRLKLLRQLKQKQLNRYVFWSLKIILEYDEISNLSDSKTDILQTIKSSQRRDSKKSDAKTRSFEYGDRSKEVVFDDWDSASISLILAVRKKLPDFFSDLIASLSTKNKIDLYKHLYAEDPDDYYSSELIRLISKKANNEKKLEDVIDFSNKLVKLDLDKVEQFWSSLGQDFFKTIDIQESQKNRILLELLDISLVLNDATFSEIILERLWLDKNENSRDEEKFVRLALNLLNNKDKYVQNGTALVMKKCIDKKVGDPYLRGLLAYAFGEAVSRNSKTFSLVNFAVSSIITQMAIMAREYKSIEVQNRVEKYFVTPKNKISIKVFRGSVLSNTDKTAGENSVVEAINDIVVELANGQLSKNQEDNEDTVDLLEFAITTLTRINPKASLEYFEHFPPWDRLFMLCRFALSDIQPELKYIAIEKASTVIEKIKPPINQFVAQIKLARVAHIVGNEELFHSKLDYLLRELSSIKNEHPDSNRCIYFLELADIAPNEYIDKVVSLLSRVINQENKGSISIDRLHRIEDYPAQEEIWLRLADIYTSLSDKTKTSRLENLAIISLNLARINKNHPIVSYVTNWKFSSNREGFWFSDLELKAYIAVITSYSDHDEFNQSFSRFIAAINEELKSSSKRELRNIFDSLKILVKYYNPTVELIIIDKLLDLFEAIKKMSVAGNEEEANEFFASLVDIWNESENVSVILHLLPLLTIYNYKQYCISKIVNILEEALNQKRNIEINLRSLVDYSIFSPIGLAECASLSSMMFFEKSNSSNKEAVLLSIMDQIDVAESAV
ncbi:MAG: ATP-binding protein [Anaerolineales bacterium]